MAPIRVAIIGLSSTAVTSWASSAHLPYLQSPQGHAKYRIVALCNSSVEAAQRAIQTYKLDPETRAYGDPQAVADDPDVDLVVCCTRVDVHYSTILPSVKAGKNVFVEWPLAHNIDRIRELADAASASGSKTMIGLQGRVAPPVVKLRQLLEDGNLGKVLSSEIRAAGGSVDREILSSGLEYFTRREVGGNVFIIGFGHLFDQIQHVLGDFVDLQGRLLLQRPNVKLRDASTQKITETKTSNVPDLFITTATLKASSIAQKNATVLARFRRGQQFQGEPPLVWSINCEKGEIRLTAHGGQALHASAYTAPVLIEIDDFESGELRKIEWQWGDWQEELPFVARSIGRLYDLFADGDHDKYPSFESARVRHEQLQGLMDSWLSGQE